MLALLGGHFARAEPRDLALAYVQALLADPARGSAVEIAARAGAGSVWSTQRLLTRTVWDADLLRDSVRSHVVPRLGASGPCVVLCRHETVRAGTGAVAVAPAGAVGRERNTQVAALLCYVSRGVGGLIDRELYLPPRWTSDPERCARAGVPPERVRPQSMADLGQEMLERAVAASVPIGWVFGGPEFADPGLRRWLCLRRLPFCVELPQIPGPRCRPRSPGRTSPGNCSAGASERRSGARPPASASPFSPAATPRAASPASCCTPRSPPPGSRRPARWPRRARPPPEPSTRPTPGPGSAATMCAAGWPGTGTPPWR